MIFGKWVGVNKTKVKFDNGYPSGFLNYCSLGWILIIFRKWVGVKKTKVKVDSGYPSGVLRYCHSKTIFDNSCSGFVLYPGTREAAFVHSISAAGVAHAVTRACSSGELERCGCDRTVRGTSPEGFQWAGCSDNVAFGAAFSQTFVDARERGRVAATSSRALMNLHNNEAGRRVSSRVIMSHLYR